MELPFVTLDVFTRTRFRGNPLAIITLPPTLPTPLTTAQKLAIAREFNLSETVFLHEPDQHDDDKESRRIDIFLTQGEIPFAGHPTVGAAVALFPQGVRRLLTKAGPIAITPLGPDAARVCVPHNVHLHARCLGSLSAPRQAGLQDDALVAQREREAPLFSIVKGVTFALVELPSLELLALVRPTGAVFSGEQLLDQGWNEGFIGRYYYVRTATSDNDNTVCIRSRMVVNSFEDPATGAAASCLASYLSTEGEASSAPSAPTRTRRYEITQGVEMGRESNITVDVSVKDSAIETVALAGPAVQVMRGHVTL